MRRLSGLVVLLAALLLSGRAEAQSCNGCGIGYWYGGVPATGGTFTGAIKLPNGSVSAPALAFTTQTNSGIYMPAANFIDFALAGALVGRFSTSGGGQLLLPGATGEIRFGAAGNAGFTYAGAGALTWVSVAFASLGTPANGTMAYCSDCTVAAPCAGSGTGALAKRLNGAWVCN